VTGTSSDQIIDELDVRLRRGDRMSLILGWVLLALGVSGVAVQVVMWPHTAGPVVAVLWPAIFVAVAVANLTTCKRVRIMQEHIRTQREHIRTLTGRRR
jgi:hypothetical protein